jgi:hypothetical protein
MRAAIPPLSQYVFMAWCLVKYRDNFTFYFTAPSYKYNDVPLDAVYVATRLASLGE